MKTESFQPFSSIAPIYDELMKDVNYEEWVDYIIKLFNFSKIPITKVLDVGCGTCSPSLILLRRGFEVFGLDSSLEMLKVAKNKSKNLISLINADIRSFAMKTKFDAVISIFDTLNNILDEKDLGKAFLNIRGLLKIGGPFIFDMNTIYCFREYWGNDVKIKETERTLSIWETYFDPYKNISTLIFTVFVKRNSHWEKFTEIHKERGYPLRTVKGLLKKAGFYSIHFFEHLTLSKVNKKTLRFTCLAI